MPNQFSFNPDIKKVKGEKPHGEFKIGQKTDVSGIVWEGWDSVIVGFTGTGMSDFAVLDTLSPKHHKPSTHRVRIKSLRQAGFWSDEDSS